MRKYHFSKLTKLQLTIKIILLSSIFVGLYLLINLVLNLRLGDIYKLYLIPLIIILLTTIINYIKSEDNRSFYFESNNLVITNNSKEEKIIFSYINYLELLTDIDSLFGNRKIIIHTANSKVRNSIMLKKEDAKKLIFWIQAKLEDYREPLIDDLYEFLKD